MRISMEDRMQQLQNQPNTKGIGENSVQGGRADNRGENNGIMQSGNAIDSGKGGGSVGGGDTLNLHTNNHIMSGGLAKNEGVNNGGAEGGNSTNFGLNNNELNGGSASNELGSTNHENSFIKGGNAVRELQSGIEKYQGMQKQLVDANKEIIRKNNELLKLQTEIESQKEELKKQQQELMDQGLQSKNVQDNLYTAQQVLVQNEKEKLQLNNDLIKAKDDITQLHSDMNIQRDEIEKLKAQVDSGKQEIQDIEAKLEQANGNKEKLEDRLKIQQERNKKQEERITEIQDKIEEKNKVIDMLNQKLFEAGRESKGLTTKISRLNNDITYLTGVLNEKVKTESACSSKVSNLEEKLNVLENEKKALNDLLQSELRSYEQLAETYRIYKLSVEQDMNVFNQLKPMLSQIGDLASQGEEILNDPTPPKTTITFVDQKALKNIHANGGAVENHGENNGIINGGPTYSESTIIEKVEINCDDVLAKLSSEMSGLANESKVVGCQALDSVKDAAIGAAKEMNAFAQTKTLYQVW